MRPPGSVVLLACGALLLGSCGTASGGRAASLAGDVVGRALSGSGTSEKPSTWSRDTARCGLFTDHRMACPTIRSCGALLGTAEPELNVNVCVDKTGDLDPVKWCTYGRNWCRASEFPACESAQQWPCDDFDTVVCEQEVGRQRILRSQIDPVSGRCSYHLATLRDDPETSSDSTVREATSP